MLLSLLLFVEEEGKMPVMKEEEEEEGVLHPGKTLVTATVHKYLAFEIAVRFAGRSKCCWEDATTPLSKRGVGGAGGAERESVT